MYQHGDAAASRSFDFVAQVRRDLMHQYKVATQVMRKDFQPSILTHTEVISVVLIVLGYADVVHSTYR